MSSFLCLYFPKHEGSTEEEKLRRLWMKYLEIVAEFIDPLLGVIVNSGIGLSYRPASHVAWRDGTTTLCRQLFSNEKNETKRFSQWKKIGIDAVLWHPTDVKSFCQLFYNDRDGQYAIDIFLIQLTYQYAKRKGPLRWRPTSSIDFFTVYWVLDIDRNDRVNCLPVQRGQRRRAHLPPPRYSGPG